MRLRLKTPLIARRFGVLALAISTSAFAFSGPAMAQDKASVSSQLEQQVIEWRRDFHEYPELSNREFKTAEKIAKHLESLGLEVETGIAHTGVVALLKGGKPGPTIAMRADIDALPVVERTDVPFKSEVTSEYRGNEVGVMHACGHDTHIAMLLGAATYLTENRENVRGDILFIFQPAEEGAPEGEEGGAELMLKEGLFTKYEPEAAFGIHITSGMNTGVIGYRKGPLMASSDTFEITVEGRQTHGSRPWGGVDPIVTAAQIINNTQTIVSRQIDITKAPAVVSFGIVEGGVRNNIIPDEVTLIGTIRNFDMGIRQQIFDKLTHTAESTAVTNGAEAHVHINEGYPVTMNDVDLVTKMLPTVEAVAGAEKVVEMPLITGAEDFSFYALEVPGMFVFLGATPPGENPAEAPSNHSPLFYVDEDALKTGTNLYINWALDYGRDG
ncbi:carboxypeptidase Ss1. Metallo peptidase. MEROPS family M20D [Pseudidiomarina planktonica]|uniref:Carboxypeptidase Ss1. Metallo peptidase. MEROPS family M20D n=2 Tax=Pseudidiomarina planktonica TaxID=1323738 RepID=A0A1Y6G387_9GAMM|nr:carboxypeptidase Ss1. Metallo peptidase. MEROPS family M20D [Pseudidiomarina planktonica]